MSRERVTSKAPPPPPIHSTNTSTKSRKIVNFTNKRSGHSARLTPTREHRSDHTHARTHIRSDQIRLDQSRAEKNQIKIRSPVIGKNKWKPETSVSGEIRKNSYTTMLCRIVSSSLFHPFPPVEDNNATKKVLTVVQYHVGVDIMPGE